MRKLTGLAVAAFAFALFAQEAAQENQNVAQEAAPQEVAQAPAQTPPTPPQQGMSPRQMLEELQTQQAVLQQQVRTLEQKLQEVKTAKAETPAVVEVPAATPAPAAPAFPRIRQGGNVDFVPRMDITTRNRAVEVLDGDGEVLHKKGSKVEDYQGNFNANWRRIIFAWNYRFNVAVNDKLDLGFRLADPSGGVGSSVANWAGAANILRVTVPNAWFTWKAADAFHLSGGLVNIPSSSTLNAATLILNRDPIASFAVVHYNSLAGLDFSFPVAPEARFYLTAGFADNARSNAAPFIVEKDTVRSYNDGRIIVGTDLTLAERKVTLRPSFQMLTRGGLNGNLPIPAVRNADGEITTPASINKDISPVLAYGADMGFVLADPFTLNVHFGGANESGSQGKDVSNNLVSVGLEPVLTFGGENNRLFNFRVRYDFTTLSRDTGDKDVDKDTDNAVLHFIDARFGINVAPRFSIVPRYRLWSSNHETSLLSVSHKDHDGSRANHRFELGFHSSF